MPDFPIIDEGKEGAFYKTYATTTFLILTAHLVYFGQTISQRSRRSQQDRQQYETVSSSLNSSPASCFNLVNYNIIVRRKHFHRILGAFLSHNAFNHRSQTRHQDFLSGQHNNIDLEAQEQNWNDDDGGTSHDRRCWRFFRARRYFSACRFDTIRTNVPSIVENGLPLLWYCTHLLWSCRALEVTANRGMFHTHQYDAYSYARMLWTLTMTGLVLDLVFTYGVLEFVRDRKLGTSRPFQLGASYWTSSLRVDPQQNSNDGNESWSLSTTENSSLSPQLENVLIHRRIGGLTMTTSAVLFVFQKTFHSYVPLIPVLSILEWPFLKIPLVADFLVSASYLLALGVLLLLSRSTHPVAGIVFGSAAGMLWTWDWTTLFAEPYWFYGTLCVYVFLCLLTFKALSSHNCLDISCIDFVPWNSRGEIMLSSNEDEGQHIRQNGEEGIQNEGNGYGGQLQSYNNNPLQISPGRTECIDRALRIGEEDNIISEFRTPLTSLRDTMRARRTGSILDSA